MVRPMGLRSAADRLATDDDSMASRSDVDEVHHQQNLWIPWTVVLIGIWLLTAPFTFGYLNEANWATPSGRRGVWFSDSTHDELRAQLITWSNVTSGAALLVLGWRMLRLRRRYRAGAEQRDVAHVARLRRRPRHRCLQLGVPDGLHGRAVAVADDAVDGDDLRDPRDPPRSGTHRARHVATRRRPRMVHDVPRRRGRDAADDPARDRRGRRSSSSPWSRWARSSAAPAG